MDPETMDKMLEDIDHYAFLKNLTRKEMADKLNIPLGTFKKWFLKGKDRREPTISHIKTIREFFDILEAEKRAEKIRLLLILVNEELTWFREGSRGKRDCFRRAIDQGDAGYVSSLLIMLGEEDKFERWSALTTHRYKSFKKAGET